MSHVLCEWLKNGLDNELLRYNERWRRDVMKYEEFRFLCFNQSRLHGTAAVAASMNHQQATISGTIINLCTHKWRPSGRPKMGPAHATDMWLTMKRTCRVVVIVSSWCPRLSTLTSLAREVNSHERWHFQPVESSPSCHHMTFIQRATK